MNHAPLRPKPPPTGDLLYCGACSTEETCTTTIQHSDVAPDPSSSSSSSPHNNHEHSTTTNTTVRSTLFVQGICCASEVPAIRRILHPYRVQINIPAKRVYVHHPPSVRDLASRLEACGFDTQVLHDGSRQQSAQQIVDVDALFAQTRRSPFVESTIALSTPQSRSSIELKYLPSQVRTWKVVGTTLHVEHDPQLVSVDELLAHLPGHCTLLHQGNEFLPHKEDDIIDTTHHHPTPLPRNVALAGVFWIASLVGAALEQPHLEAMGLGSVLFGLPPILRKAFQRWDANGMMVTASVGALLLGQWDEAASVSFLFCSSDYLEARATQRARTALEELVRLKPDYATVVHPTTQERRVVRAEHVPVGSLVAVPTGDKIAADGIVVEGTSAIDESSLTGESIPVPKTVHDAVQGGGINVGHTPLLIRTTTSVQNSAVSKLVRLVEEAQANTSPTEKMIDGFARSYTPIVLFLALTMCTIPWFFGFDTGKHWMLNGLIVIVIACPCALTISTPVTYAAGLAATAQRGIVVKGGASLEALGSVRTVLLDKTGTLTEGKFHVTHLDLVGTQKTRKEMLELLVLLETPSSHPLSTALVKAAHREGVTAPPNVSVQDHTTLQGEGVTAQVQGQQVWVGNERLMDRLQIELDSETRLNARDWSSRGSTVGFLATQNDGILGAFAVTDKVRDDAPDLIHAFHALDVHMLTGDSVGAAEAVARQIGLPLSKVHAGLRPEDKLHWVSRVQDEAATTTNTSFNILRRRPTVLFCGDGVNDGPALAAADIGVAMGEGAALAMELSDVTLMDSQLHKLVYVQELGQRVVQTIQENIALSLVCKVVVVGLTFAGSMTLLYAIASDVGVMLLVTLNGMKLLPSSTDGSSSSWIPWPSRLVGGGKSYIELSQRHQNHEPSASEEEEEMDHDLL